MCVSESGLTTEFALCARHADDSDNCEALPQAAREIERVRSALRWTLAESGCTAIQLLGVSWYDKL